KKSITIYNHEILYTLRRSSRSRGIRLSITSECELRISANRLLPEFLIRQYIKQKGDWILEKLDVMKARNKNKIQITDKTQKQEIRDKAIVSVLTKIKKWNENLGFEIRKITVKEQKTSWGTCTR